MTDKTDADKKKSEADLKLAIDLIREANLEMVRANAKIDMATAAARAGAKKA